MADTPQTFNSIIDWIAAHPVIAVDFGPWLLIAAGIASLLIIHIPIFSLGRRHKKTDARQDVEKQSASPDTMLDIGSLRCEKAWLKLKMKDKRSAVSGAIELQMKNASDFLIKYHAVTAGNINGMPFDVNKVEFDGLVYPNSTTLLVSNTIFNFPISDKEMPGDLWICGVFEYDIRYKKINEGIFSRRTARGVRIVQDWAPPVPKQPGITTIELPATTIFYNEIEE